MEELVTIEGELEPVGEKTAISKSEKAEISLNSSKNSEAWIQYFVVPLIFLFVALLGGMRLGAENSEFIFLRPALVCLIFATILLILFFRARLIRFEGWLSDQFSPLQNTSNALILLALFAASTQVFNSLIPEQGLLFWLVAFFFLWSLWTNLFAEFDTKKLLISIGSLFGFAFIAKYLVLSSLTAPSSGGFVQAIFSGDLTKEAITYLLDLPRYSSGTGYIQFFALILYLIGLFLLSPTSAEKARE